MDIYTGKSASKGIAIGRVWELVKKDQKVLKRQITDVVTEITRFEQAKEEALRQLKQLYEQAVGKVGKESAAIFEVHQMLLEDEEFTDYVTELIESKYVNAEFAVSEAKDYYVKMFSEMEDAYMKERAADIKDISERLIKILTEKSSESETDTIPDAAVIVADDLTPSETLSLSKSHVLALVTRQGSINSHTAILTRTLNIPAIVSVLVPKDLSSQMVVVDGVQGKIVVNPDTKTIGYYEGLKRESDEKQNQLSSLKGVLTQTSDGRAVKLYANIQGEEDLLSVLSNDAEGIGLFRTEFIYLKSNHLPTEEEQFQIYKNVVLQMNGKKVIFRTFDLGADKRIDYLPFEPEENPALGLRAIRICLNHPDIFITQLRALYRAAYYGPISIMIPMITSLWEVKKVKEIMNTVKGQLNEEGLLYKEAEFGIMIETPAAVMISDELAKHVDFFSIGTNDLTQYTLAIDRQNAQLEKYYDAHHPAVLQMIQMVVGNAHKAGIWVGVCGELGADLSMIPKFVSMGIDELSVVPTMILPIRNTILQLSYNDLTK